VPYPYALPLRSLNLVRWMLGLVSYSYKLEKFIIFWCRNLSHSGFNVFPDPCATSLLIFCGLLESLSLGFYLNRPHHPVSAVVVELGLEFPGWLVGLFIECVWPSLCNPYLLLLNRVLNKGCHHALAWWWQNVTGHSSLGSRCGNNNVSLSRGSMERERRCC
jgi:hypothetical protein